jgi:hypothetical protein
VLYRLVAVARAFSAAPPCCARSNVPVQFARGRVAQAVACEVAVRPAETGGSWVRVRAAASGFRAKRLDFGAGRSGTMRAWRGSTLERWVTLEDGGTFSRILGLRTFGSLIDHRRAETFEIFIVLRRSPSFFSVFGICLDGGFGKK